MPLLPRGSVKRCQSTEGTRKDRRSFLLNQPIFQRLHQLGWSSKGPKEEPLGIAEARFFTGQMPFLLTNK